MKTDTLIDTLATRAEPIARGAPARRYAIALAVGTACALLAMLTLLGPRRDLAAAIDLPMFWVKLAFVAALACLGLAGAWQTSIPGRTTRAIERAIVGVVACMWIIAAIALAKSDPGQRLSLVLGNTWLVCPWLIAGLSIPVFVAIAWTVRRMAPTNLRLAGAMAGFGAGATGALVYSIHCPELGAPFLGTWYLIGMLLPVIVGWLAGERLFRW
jgi:hypothetical protein